MAADALLSLGVVVGGGVILATGWLWVDPITSLIIAAVILVSTWDLLRESLHLAMQAVPSKIDIDAIEQFLNETPGVDEVHDLHVWAMSTTEVALTVHLVKPNIGNDDALLRQITETLHDRFEIGHSTIQIERSVSDANCGQAEAGSL